MLTRESLFQNPQFARFYCGDVATQLGSAITFIVVPLIAVAVLHATPFDVGLIAACARAPFMLFTLLAGVTADRRERRAILLVTNMVRFSMLFALTLIAWSGHLSIPFLLLGVFIVGCANVYFEVAYWSYLPSLVPLHLIARASGALAAIAGAGELLGPALGGILIKLTSASGTLLLNALLFLAGSSLLLGLPKNHQASSEKQRSSSLIQIKEGMTTLFRHPALRRLTIIGAAWNLFACTATPQLVVYLSRDVGLDASSVGLVLASQGMGGLIGALCASLISDRWGAGRAILLGGIVYGLFSLAICLPDLFPRHMHYLDAVFLFFAGWGSSVGVVNILSMRQRVCPSPLLGRVNASFRFITWGIMPACALLGGALSQFFGSHAVIMGACIGGLLSILLSFKSGVAILRQEQDVQLDIST
ncbi:MFS transporter [Pantoea sp. BS_8]|uniref:MFS transporter n=1 Tax=Pantoea sp. BS_8 TaxID=3055781 RepID=UPI0035BF7C73